MALSNAERQARYRRRVHDRAAEIAGITPTMVREVVELLYRWACREHDVAPDWPGFVAACRPRRGRKVWLEFVPDDVRPDAYDWIDDPAQRALVERVAAVAHAMRTPPMP